jgi:predicted dehydrogenase
MTRAISPTNFRICLGGFKAASVESEKRKAKSENVLGVGVVGLGPLWQRRYRPALAALRGLFRVAAVCDQVVEQAEREAKRLGCPAAPGPTALLENSGVGALLLMDPQWFGLWPAEAASRYGKPVFCGTPLAPGDGDAVWPRVREAGVPLLLARTPRAAPALGRLSELLAGPLGPARCVLCEGLEVERAGPEPGGEEALLDACSTLVPGDPIRVLAVDLPHGRLASVLLEFPEGRAVHIVRCPAPGPRGGVRVRVVAERGTAVADLPHHVHWTDAAGGHTHVLPEKRPAAQLLLEHFYQVVREGRPPLPGVEHAEHLAGWLWAAARSREQGRWVELLS